METPKLSLLMFSCSGREHLLSRTCHAWRDFLPPVERILVLDGAYEEKSAENLGFDFVLHSKRRQGYVASIMRSLPLIKSEFIFWLEDDWEPLTPVNVGQALDFLTGHRDCIQLRWSKRAPLDRSGGALGENIYRSEGGFSANPSLCRTDLLREAFAALQEAEKGARPGRDGFENFLTRWCSVNHVTCAVLDPGDKPAVVHTGYLESTRRKWHMTESIESSNANPSESLAKRPALWRRFWMLAKLAGVFSRLAIRQLYDNSCYDLAFRIIATFTKGGD